MATRRRLLLLTAAVLAAAAAAVAVYLGAAPAGAPGRPPLVVSREAGPPPDPEPRVRLRVAWPVGRPLRVLFVGDSLTVGEDAVRRGSAFPALVSTALRAHGHVLETVRAARGVTTAYWASRPLPAADLVVLELGTNDFSAHLTPPAAFERAYSRLVANVRAGSGHAQLLCLSLWRSSHYGYEGRSLLTYNRLVASECRGGAFVWISDLYDAPGARLPRGLGGFLGKSDGFHPNDVGHRAIARAIEQTLRLR